MSTKPIAPAKPPAPDKPLAPAKPAPFKPAPQVDFGLQWRAQNGLNRNEVTGNTADAVRNSVPGAVTGGSGVSGGIQLRW